MLWLQDPNQRNVDYLNNVTCLTSRHFRKKTRNYMKAEIGELEHKVR